MTGSKFLLFFLLSSLIAIASNAQDNKFIYTQGKNVMLPGGEPFIMRGTNLGNWLVPEGYMFKFSTVNSPRLINETFSELIGAAAVDSFWKAYLNNYITRADIQYLKKIGMNSIRIPFNYRLFSNEHYMGESNPEHGFELLDRVTGWCKQEGLYVILDMHCAPGGQTGDNIDDGFGYPFLFESDADQELATNIWKRIAKHYSDEPIIIGYDLLNEPIAHYFDTAHFNPRLEPLYKKMTAAIREVDTNHIIFLGGAQWDSNFDPFGPPFDNKLIYTFHKYWTPPAKEVIQPYLDFRDKYKVPIYCGETGENTNGWIDSFRTTLENEKIGWHFWPYKKMDSESCIVGIVKPSFFDLIINYAESPRISFAEIRKARPRNMEAVRKAFQDYLDKCLFENCRSNTGYMEALGFFSH